MECEDRASHCGVTVSPAPDGAALRFSVTLETVLAGHENWVYGVHWQPALITGNHGDGRHVVTVPGSRRKTSGFCVLYVRGFSVGHLTSWLAQSPQ